MHFDFVISDKESILRVAFRLRSVTATTTSVTATTVTTTSITATTVTTTSTTNTVTTLTTTSVTATTITTTSVTATTVTTTSTTGTVTSWTTTSVNTTTSATETTTLTTTETSQTSILVPELLSFFTDPKTLAESWNVDRIQLPRNFYSPPLRGSQPPALSIFKDLKYLGFTSPWTGPVLDRDFQGPLSLHTSSAQLFMTPNGPLTTPCLAYVGLMLGLSWAMLSQASTWDRLMYATFASHNDLRPPLFAQAQAETPRLAVSLCKKEHFSMDCSAPVFLSMREAELSEMICISLSTLLLKCSRFLVWWSCLFPLARWTSLGTHISAQI